MSGCGFVSVCLINSKTLFLDVKEEKGFCVFWSIFLSWIGDVSLLALMRRSAAPYWIVLSTVFSSAVHEIQLHLHLKLIQRVFWD
ncbi:MAG: hypothetical protein ACRCZO_11500, partial [Cetobacterium sp.]